MRELIEFLRAASETGNTITVAYGGGSRPGQARQLSIASHTETDLRAYEEGARQAKQYKIAKILWAENSLGERVTNIVSTEVFKSALPQFDTLLQYSAYLKSELASAGWYIYQLDDLLGVGTLFKNGEPKKTPSIAIRYIERSNDVLVDIGEDELVPIKLEPTGIGRPWRVDSWRFKEGKSFGLLHSAMCLFIEEVRASDPQQAKGMFAGH